LTATYDSYLRHMAQLHALNLAQGLLSWDQETMMPPRGLEARAHTRAVLSGLAHDMLVDPAFGELLDGLAAQELPHHQQVNIRETRRDRDRAVKIPRELVTEISRVSSLAQKAWQQAREQESWAVFSPLLQELVQLRRREAEAVGYRDEPYDALLDAYEPDTRVADILPLLDTLREGLVRMVRAIGERPPHDDAVLRRRYPVAGQMALSRRVLQDMGFDFRAGRLDVSTHPFTADLGPTDVRLTTRYDENDLGNSLFSTIHEGGHGLYEQGLPADRAGTPLGEAVSLGIHESQSRLWENLVGRSRPFADYLLPLLREHFPGVADDVDADALYRACNVVRPSLVRTEADEVTYNLHILLRLELERELVRGNIGVDDLPALWRERMREYLGVEPTTLREGVLQDIHWSFGLFGYFPTYTLGNLYAAQIFAAARADLPELDKQMAAGEFYPLRDWLREKIHRRGRELPPRELCRAVTGRDLAVEPFLETLAAKFGPLYALEPGEILA